MIDNKLTHGLINIIVNFKTMKTEIKKQLYSKGLQIFHSHCVWVKKKKKKTSIYFN